MMNAEKTLEQIPCNLCGAHDSARLYIKDELEIARCRRCGLVYAHPRLTHAEIWKRYSPTYFWDEYMPAHGATHGEFLADWHHHRARPILEYLKPFQRTGTLLEVGCAAGFFLKIATEDGWKASGVELMQPAVTYARETLGLDVIVGTLEQAQFAADSFDVVVMIETIEHLLDPASVLREAYRILRPGGAVWLATPNLNSLMRALLGVDWSVLSPAEHLYYFTEETLARMVRQIGFQSATFHWRLGQPDLLDTLNPYNTHHPHSMRSHLAKWNTLLLGRALAPLAIAVKRTDRLSLLAVK